MRLATPLAEHLRWYFESGTGVSAAGVDALGTAADDRGDGRRACRRPQRRARSGRRDALDALAVREDARGAGRASAGRRAGGAARGSRTRAGRRSGKRVRSRDRRDFAEEAAEILDNSEAALQDVRERQDQLPSACCSGISTR